MDEWDRRAGFARILPFDGSKGAAFYIAKYITKQGGEWAISENLGNLETQQILSLRGAKTAGYHALPVVPKPRKYPRTTKQLQKQLQKWLLVPDLPSRPAPSVMDVYREEVTRFGKGRFREFLWPR